jgi:hypothetical protein
MPVDPQLAPLLELFYAVPTPPVSQLTPEQNRAQYAKVVAMRRGEGYVAEDVGSFADVSAGGVPARLYRPAGRSRPGVLV